MKISRLFPITVFFAVWQPLSMLPASTKNSVTFPGRYQQIVSPNKQYTIKNVDQSGNDPRLLAKNYPSKLYFSRRGSIPFLLRTYPRTVDILWSQDSQSFILNDWYGSNVTTCYLYRVSNLSHPVEITPILYSATRGSGELGKLRNAASVYVFASHWEAPNRVTIKAAGHSDEGKEFTLTYKWDLKHTFVCVKKVSKEEFSRDVPPPVE